MTWNKTHKQKKRKDRITKQKTMGNDLTEEPNKKVSLTYAVAKTLARFSEESKEK